MGQTTSKTHSEDSPPVTAPPVTATSPSINTSTDIASPQSSTPEPANTEQVSDLMAKNLRRSSIRQNLLNLVKPRASASRSDSVRSRVNSSVSSTTLPSGQSSRRYWRTSKRWSKTPELTDPTPSDIESNPPSETPPAPPPQLSGKGKAKEDEGVSDVSQQADTTAGPSRSATIPDRPPTPFPYSSTSTVTDPEPFSIPPLSDATTPDPQPLTKGESDVSHHIGSWLGGQSQGDGSAASLANRLGLEPRTETTEDETPIGPQSEANFENMPDTTTASLQPPAPTVEPPPLPAPSDSTDPTPTPTPPPRQFPPPGTLVVVQGVVHTTDVPRHPPPPDVPTSRSNLSLPRVDLQRRASSTPRPSTPSAGERFTNNTRNRLSALIPRPRPNSMFSRPPSQEDTPRRAGESPQTPALDADATTSSVGGHSGPPTAPGAVEGREGDGTQNGPISSSSIDVLGTLLSVAAAATAASLLTGSSEPIFTSGLAPPTSFTGNPNNLASPTVTRPTSPTPTTGLGIPAFGFGVPGSEATPGQEPAGARGRDRVRNAWGSLRERLGLRAANPPSAIPTNEPNLLSRTRPDGTPMDAREVMLAEMARAFNLGLGLGADGTGAPNRPPPENETTSSTGGGSNDIPQVNPRSGRSLPPEDSFERFLIDLQAELRVALSHPGVEVVPHPSPSQPQAPDIEPTSPPETVPSLDPDPLVSTATGPDLPPLGDVIDSEGEDEFDGSEEEANSSTTTDSDMPPLLSNNPSNATFPFIPSASTSTSADTSGGVPHVAAPGSASQTEHRPGGGINWWRLYRFPAISAPQAPGILAALNNTSSATPTTPGPDSQPDGEIAATPEELSQMPPHTPPPTNEARPNIVIPVIVVGLQSVNMNRRREQRASENEDPSGGGDANLDAGLDDEAEFEGFPGPPVNDNVNAEPQQRSWHARAANAIRNLRPGRRGASQEARPGENPGSRTFLIYVIGGYYPPDHHIVTGANTLDSFEALWELAELLGQVRPPTVTKEEIEKSGLEILKPAVLEQYEKDGKVAANCMEKCLICLDEYEPEDDVRLLGCRHAFHKNCVDKWLQTGRNNCPACRSRGVFNDINPGPQAPTVA